MKYGKSYSIIQNLKYLICETKEGYSRLLLFCCLIILVNSIIPVINAFLPKIIIDRLLLGDGIKSVLLMTLAFTLVLALFMGLQEYLDRLIYWHKYKMNLIFLRKITRKGLTTDYKNQENEEFRKLQSESFASCNGQFSYYAQTYDAVVMFFSNVLGFIAFFGILITLNPLLIIFLCVTTAVSFLLNNKNLKWLEKHNAEKVGYEQRMQYIISASENTHAAKDIRVYNMSGWLNCMYDDNMHGLLNWYRKYTYRLFGVAAVDSSLTLVREGVTYVVLIYMVLARKISIADFVLYFSVVAGFSPWLSSILSQITNLKRLNMAINRFRSYLEYPETYLRNDGIQIENKSRSKSIVLDNVCLRYEGSEKNVINKMNLRVAPGEHLAIVGLNGAGKTTLVKLISGLIEPTDGIVYYDSIDIKKYDRNSYYQVFGTVFQDNSILPVTIEDIVADGSCEMIDSVRVEECLKEAGLWEKIVSLDKGILSHYDKSFWEDGINLSGGEIQKLMLARALYKNAPIVILDEPTAALDPIAENNLYETYDEIMKDKTTIFISHRLASTRFCNRIILIENGMIVEEGTHDELLSLKGKYYELFETQAKYYRENSNSDGEEDSYEN